MVWALLKPRGGQVLYNTMQVAIAGAPSSHNKIEQFSVERKKEGERERENKEKRKKRRKEGREGGRGRKRERERKKRMEERLT